jgi:sulfoxide reductase catalytic subunit YedY
MNERDVTPEALFRSRRAIVKAAGFGLAGAGIAGPAHAGFFDNLFGGGGSAPAPDAETDPSAGLYPAPRNAEFSVAQPITDERLATSYNNFYEFGSHKEIAKAAQALPIRPWTVTLDGMVEAEQTLDIDDLLGRVALQERVYRFRCVETWSMVVPWTGFPLADLVAIARPSAGARYVRMETFLNPEVAPGQRQSWYPWPYVEGLTMEEATHPLTMMVTGAYGKPLEEQNGAPIRLIVPWKYGFKSVKSVVRLTFTDERPQTFWMDLAGDEYGFFANVNPEVAHPRWSQAMEQPLGQDERVPTLLYNGYAEEVAGLYSGTTEKIFF